MIKRIFYILLFFIIGSIIYLNFIGISTSKLNKKIQTEISDKYPQINLKLNDIKILLNISKLSIDLETVNHYFVQALLDGNKNFREQYAIM